MTFFVDEKEYKDMESLFNGFGIEIIKRNGNYILRYDAGELVTSIEEIEITREEVEKVKVSPKDAYNIVIKYQNIKLGL